MPCLATAKSAASKSSGTLCAWRPTTNYVFLKSSKLRCVDHHSPRGTHDILCVVPLTGGVGTQVEASTPDGVHYDLQGELSIRGCDLSLTDYLGRPVNLRGRPLAMQLTFDN